MDMLAELMIANAAFKVIKTTIANGREIADAGTAITKYFGAEKAINKQVKAGTGNVMEAFQAQEQLKKNERDLEFMLNKQRLHGYVDFCKFRKQYNAGLKIQATNRKKANAKATQSTMTIALSAGIFLILAIAGVFFGVAKVKGLI
jgi:pyridoxal biosynthesis lyase PdxS